MQINELTLKSLCRKFHYDISGGSIIIFAFRGSFPLQCMGPDTGQAGKPERVKTIVSKKINYKKAACSIGIWLTDSGEIAIFPGSTVPSLNYLHLNPDASKHFNILCPGKYNLVKGIHPRNIAGYQRHEALIMPGEGLIMRPQLIRKPRKTSFNFKMVDYDVIFPGDNLHASRTEPYLPDPDATPEINNNYSSSGCLTIIGQPEEYVNNKLSFFWNSWEQFMQLIKRYSTSKNLSLLLFNYSDLSNNDKYGNRIRLRYGSQGSQVTELQKKLSEIYSPKADSVYYTGKHDGLMHAGTVKAWLRFTKDYSPEKISAEVNIEEFRSKTSHFIFTLKHYEHVIN